MPGVLPVTGCMDKMLYLIVKNAKTKIMLRFSTTVVHLIAPGPFGLSGSGQRVAFPDVPVLNRQVSMGS